MEVFESHVTERAEWALPIDSKKFEELWKLADLGAPAGDRWTPFEVEIMRKQGGRAFKESDCPSIGSGFLVLRPAAVEVFSPFLGGDAELLDLHCADADLKLLNVWRHLDALNLSNSDVVRFPSSGRIMRVKSYAFDDAAIEGHDMFRLSAMPRAAS